MVMALPIVLGFDGDGIDNATESDTGLAIGTDANNDGLADIKDNYDGDGDGVSDF